MALTLKKEGGGEFEQIPAGTYAGRCYMMVDLGTQYNKTYENHQHKVRLGWELNELMKDGRPFVISKLYTASLNEKANLRHDLESWRGKTFSDDELMGFELKAVLGAPAMISVVHSEYQGKTYANVASVTAPPKGMQVPDPVNNKTFFEINADGSYDHDAYAKVPEWLQKKIMEAEELKLKVVEEPSEANPPPMLDDDIPF